MKIPFPSFEVVPSFGGDRSLRGWSLRNQRLTLLFWSRRFNIRTFWVRVVMCHKSRRAWAKWTNILTEAYSYLSYKMLTILSNTLLAIFQAVILHNLTAEWCHVCSWFCNTCYLPCCHSPSALSVHTQDKGLSSALSVQCTRVSKFNY